MSSSVKWVVMMIRISRGSYRHIRAHVDRALYTLSRLCRQVVVTSPLKLTVTFLRSPDSTGLVWHRLGCDGHVTYAVIRKIMHPFTSL